jgi:replicative DNA helicase
VQEVIHEHTAELAILSCLAHGNEKVQRDMMERIREDHFYAHETRLIFLAALRIHAKRVHINWVNIEDELRGSGHFDVVGGNGKLTEIAAFCPNSNNWQRYFPSLEEARYRRSLENLANDIVVKARDRDLPLQELKEWSEVSVMKADFVMDEDDRLSTAKPIEGAIDNIEALTRGEMRRGIPTGIQALDEYLNLGLRGGDMVVLAARPAMGKSSAAMQIAEFVAVDLKKRVLIFSLEMTSTSLMERMIKSRSKIPLQTLVSGKLNQFQLDAIRTATGHIKSAPILCDDSAGKSIGYIKSVSRRAHQREAIDLIVIDYLQLVRGDSKRSRDNRTCEVEEVSNGIKELAKDLNVPVIALAQLNRDPEKRNGRPSMSDLKGSGSLEQDADICILMNFSEEEVDTFSQTPKMEFIVAKQREGPTGTGTMIFNKAITRFVAE